MKSKNKAYKVVSEVSDFLNSFHPNYAGFVEAMAVEHRTLQQSFTQLCLEWFKYLANTPYYDERNEASVMVARAVINTLGNDIRLPFI